MWRFLVLLFLTVQSAQAELVFDLNLFYLSDSFSYTDDSSNGRLTYDVMIGAGLDRRGKFVLGWNYSSFSFEDDPGDAEVTVAVTDMGPRIVYYFDKELTFNLALTYNLITNGSYNSDTVETELRGTSYRAEIGYTPKITESLFIGAKLQYYVVSVAEEIDETTIEEVSYNRTFIYPTFTLTYRFR